ncbi:MobF family relaxase [Kineosporia babensis]|uniref:Relaxase domain-containing protein n=1 Tax=Kineosporia babensis TaxID=499548 RepID=A0A9X1NLT2_9ACTN|nr:MobF family relaxase [Kineosporia babensis]MCD5316139.1 relaxase domain-containing protein [Kineosporia babensis]
MTIAKLTAGDGYQYLMRDIAILPNATPANPQANPQPGQDPSAYYTAEGNPPGIWIGRGRHLLGLNPREGHSVRVVEAEHMKALFGLGLHPEADARIAAYQRAHITAGMSPAEIEKVNSDALRSVTLGRPFAAYKALPPFAERVGERLAQIIDETGRIPTPAEEKRIRAEEARRQHGSVAGYDLVFAPVKSAALLWALDERKWVQDAVIAAHHEAKDATLAMLEQHAAFTRTGTNGIAQIETRGLVGVSFDHWDSRDGDPNPHTHVALSNKVQGIDGIWRTLDGRALYRLTVAASEHYNTAFQIAVTARTGVRFEAKNMGRGKQPVYEIAGISPALIKDFSRRRSALTARYEELTSAYRHQHGHDPSAAVAHKLARQANLDTRQGKKAPRSLSAMRTTWTQQALTRHGSHAIQQLMAAVPNPNTAIPAKPAVQAISVHELAARVVANVGEKRSTWTVWNLRAEAERVVKVAAAQHQPITGITAQEDGTEPTTVVVRSLADHQTAVSAVVAAATSPAQSINVEAPALLAEPASLQRSDGTSVFVQHAAGRYTSQALLDAEQRLLNAAKTGPSIPAQAALGTGPRPVPSVEWVNATLDGFEAVSGRSLDAGQRALVAAFASDQRMLVVGIGAAGTGKTTAMIAYQHTLTAQQRRLIPLAPSAAAAAVLGDDLNTPAENLAKFLHEHLNGPHSAELAAGRTENLPENIRRLAVRTGDVILIDEAGMAGTFALDRITEIAAHHGASVRLIGDYRQLSAVESGGALRLIASDAGAVELSTLHRFRNPAEADATLQLRTGDTAGLGFYEQHERIKGGSIQAMTDATYAGWWADVQAGKISVMTAANNADVTTLAARARADRVTAGHVEPDGVTLHDGNTAGTGDWIVTRHNQRRLSLNQGRDFVRNGDTWHVLHRHDDGSLQVRHLEHGGQLRLPAAYVSEHVELLYASTVHRTQGSTVDTAHTLIGAGMLREHLYVALTRATTESHLYVATHHLLPVDEDARTDAAAHDPNARAALEVLHTVLNAEGAERSATQTIRDALADSESLATLMPRYVHAVERANAAEHRRILTQILDQPAATTLLNDPAWPDIARALHTATRDGWDPRHVLKTITTEDLWNDVPTVPSPTLGGKDQHVPACLAPAGPTRAQVLADRIATLTTRHYAPAPIAQPTPDDSTRYAHLIAAITGTRPDPAHALNHPTEAGTFAPIQRPEPVASRTVYSGLLGPVIGSRLAQKATTETAWPALQNTLRRLDDAGHNPAELLRQVASRRELTNARSISSVLTWRLIDYTRNHPAPSPAPAGSTDIRPVTGTAQPQQTHDAGEAWTSLAWLLKAQEVQGTDITQILPTSTPTNGRSATLQDLITHVRRYDTTHTQLTPAKPRLPPWTPTARTSDPYIHEAAEQIRARFHQLAEHTLSAHPEWLTTLGTPPDDLIQRSTWLNQVAVVAAFRDQHQIPDDDLARPLGPYLETTHPHHHAYWQAAHAALTAHQIAHHNTQTPPAESGTRKPRSGALDPHSGRLTAAEIYRALPEAERRYVATGVVAQLGTLHIGPDPQNTAIGELDTALLHTAHTAQLHRTLRERGHLTTPTDSASTTTTAGADQRSRRATAPRPDRARKPRPTQTPAGERTPAQQTRPTTNPTTAPVPAPFVRPADPQRHRTNQPRW